MANETLEAGPSRSSGTELPLLNGGPRERPTMKRLNINLPASLLEELQQLADDQGKSMTEVVRTALGLVHIAYTQTGTDRYLTISDNHGNAIKQIVVPR